MAKRRADRRPKPAALPPAAVTPAPTRLPAVGPWAGLHAGGRAPRALAVLAALAAWALTWWVLRGTVWFTAGAAAAAGSLAADGAASRLRQRVAVGGVVAALLAAPVVRAVVAFAVARLLGATAALWLSELVFVAVAAFAVAAGLRTLALHHPAWRGVEVAAMGAAIASPVLSHRDGAWARPLALSDAAIQAGLDPLHVLVGLGVLAGFGAVVLLAAERTERPERAAALVLVPAAVLALLLMVVGGSVAELVQQVRTSVASTETDEPGAGGDGSGEDPSKGDGPSGEPRPARGGGDGVADAPDGSDQGGAAPERPDGAPQAPAGAGKNPGDQPEGDERSAGADGADERPAGDGGGDPPPAGGERPGEKPAGDKAAGRPPGDKPEGDKAAGDKPAGEDGGGGRPPGDTPEGDQPAGDKRSGEKPAGDKPPPRDPPADKGDPPPKPDDAQPPPDAQGDPPPNPDTDAQGNAGGDPLEQLFENGKSAGDPSPVAVVILDDDYLPPGETWYLRQDALSELVGFRLMPSGLDLDVPRGPMVGEERAVSPEPEGDRLPLTGRVAALVDQTAWFGPEAAVSYRAVNNPDRSRFVAAWTFASRVPASDASSLFGRTSTAAIWPGYLQYPADPRYAAKVAELLEPVPVDLRADPMAVALSITHGIGVDMVYDKGVVFEPDTDQAASFLFGGMRGYCVHAAHAAVYLMRAAGVPARIGTGYAVPGTSLRGSTLLVRGLEAHAWPEVWIDGVGWTIVDVHPEKSVTAPPPPVDEALVRQLGEAAREATGEAPPEPPDAPWRPRLPRLPWAAIGRALSTLAFWLLVGAVAGHYAAKLVRRVRPRLSSPAALPRDALIAALDALAEVGLSREVGETREAHARRVADQTATFAALCAHATRAAWGPGDAPPDRLLLLGLLDGVRADLRASVPWWRRLLGALDLTSVWRVR